MIRIALKNFLYWKIEKARYIEVKKRLELNGISGYSVKIHRKYQNQMKDTSY